MDKEKLQNVIRFIAGKHGFNLLIVEKDYHLTRILNEVNEHLSDDIIFKGGTLLNKVYLNYHRLSEDLDFSYRGDADLLTRGRRSKAITFIRKRMPAFLERLNLMSENPSGKGFNNSTQYLFNIQYESVLSNAKENVKLEISLRQPTLLKPQRVVVKHFFSGSFY